jgi:hypothetical protein
MGKRRLLEELQPLYSGRSGVEAREASGGFGMSAWTSLSFARLHSRRVEAGVEGSVG